MCSIADPALYNICKDFALNETVNIQKACDIFNQSGHRWVAWGANAICQFQ